MKLFNQYKFDSTDDIVFVIRKIKWEYDNSHHDNTHYDNSQRTTRNGQLATPTTRNKSDWSVIELVQCWNNISIGTVIFSTVVVAGYYDNNI